MVQKNEMVEIKMKERIIIYIVCFLTIILSIIIFLYNISYNSGRNNLIEIKADNIDSEINIFVDNHNIPLIRVENENDYYFALGFYHAQNRLFQMDILRRSANGKLSEILGKEFIEIDKFIRSFTFPELSIQQYEILSNECKDALNSYTNGINLFIEQNKESLPIEFSVFEYYPENWSVINSLSIFKLISLKFNSSLISESILSEIAIIIDDQIAENITNTNLNSEIINVSKRFSDFNTALKKIYTNKILNLAPISSNVWAIKNQVDSSSFPILANDLHNSILLPNLWIQSAAKINNEVLSGISVPGIPFLLIGRNANLSWGFSNMEVDNFDLFFEKYGSSKDTFINGDEEYKLEYIKDTIRIADGDKHIYYKRKSKRSIILSDYFKSNIPENINNLDAVSFEWVGKNIGTEIETIYKISKQKKTNISENQIENWYCPAIDLIIVDNKGDIKSQFLGKIPKRSSDCDAKLISASWKNSKMWNGYYEMQDFIEKEKISNYYSSANRKLNGLYNVEVSNGIYNSYRKKRIDNLIKSTDNNNLKETKYIQNDLYSIHAEVIINKYLSVLSEYEGLLNDYESYVFESLMSWDFIFSADSHEATIFSFFLKNFLSNTLKDELGDELYIKYVYLNEHPISLLDNILSDRGHIFFDDIKTPDKENRDYILYISLQNAILDLKTFFNSDIITDWKYFKLHTLQLKNINQENLFISNIISQEEMYLGGNFSTINSTSFNFAKPFEVGKSPTCRFISDLSKESYSSVIAGGVSGDPLSPHYSDQTQIWLNGGYIELDLQSTEKLNHVLKIIPSLN